MIKKIIKIRITIKRKKKGLSLLTDSFLFSLSSGLVWSYDVQLGTRFLASPILQLQGFSFCSSPCRVRTSSAQLLSCALRTYWAGTETLKSKFRGEGAWLICLRGSYPSSSLLLYSSLLFTRSIPTTPAYDAYYFFFFTCFFFLSSPFFYFYLCNKIESNLNVIRGPHYPKINSLIQVFNWVCI